MEKDIRRKRGRTGEQIFLLSNSNFLVNNRLTCTYVIQNWYISLEFSCEFMKIYRISILFLNILLLNLRDSFSYVTISLWPSQRKYHISAV